MVSNINKFLIKKSVIFRQTLTFSLGRLPHNERKKLTRIIYLFNVINPKHLLRFFGITEKVNSVDLPNRFLNILDFFFHQCLPSCNCKDSTVLLSVVCQCKLCIINITNILYLSSLSIASMPNCTSPLSYPPDQSPPAGVSASPCAVLLPCLAHWSHQAVLALPSRGHGNASSSA